MRAALPRRRRHRLEAALKALKGDEPADAASTCRSAAVEARVARRGRRLRKALDRAGAIYVPERLHQVRIAVKQLRYALEVAADVRGGRPPARLTQLRHIQDLLGRAHDLHVLGERLREVQVEVVRTSRRTAAALGRLARTHRPRLPCRTCGVHEPTCRAAHAVRVPRTHALGPPPPGGGRLKTPVPTSLELYLVRHAVAALRGPDYPDDAQRPLTPEGAERWRRSVSGLREFGLGLDVVLASPLVRAHETAEILVAGLKPKPKLVTSEALAPGRKPSVVLAEIAKYAANPRAASRLALVGHEPDLGELAARLLGAKGALEFKKGAVCRIDIDRAMPAGPGTLLWLLPPRVLRGLA